jgi:excisionase family DNA binding protein
LARQVSQTSPLLTAAQAAEMLGVSPAWLLAQARDREVPHHRLGRFVRFDEDELIEWVRESTISPRGRRSGR